MFGNILIIFLSKFRIKLVVLNILESPFKNVVISSIFLRYVCNCFLLTLVVINNFIFFINSLFFSSNRFLIVLDVFSFVLLISNSVKSLSKILGLLSKRYINFSESLGIVDAVNVVALFLIYTMVNNF